MRKHPAIYYPTTLYITQGIARCTEDLDFQFLFKYCLNQKSYSN
jgi:hypothetical protein